MLRVGFVKPANHKEGAPFALFLILIMEETMKEYTVKVYENGAKEWYLNGKFHREDGPAIEEADETKEWYLNGQLHREDGPAVERVDGTKYWYLNDKNLTEEEFNKKMKKPCKIDGKVVEIDGKKYKITEI
jgi:hypothetical protein